MSSLIDGAVSKKTWNEQHGEQQGQQFDWLYKIISKEILPHVEATRDMIQSGVISYKYLWALFPPKIDIYSKVDGQDRFYMSTGSSYQNRQIHGGSPGFFINCRYVDSDGNLIGYVDTNMAIYPFSGTKRITDLQVFPGYLHPDVETLVDKLHCRGREFEKYNGFNHVSYSGEYKELQLMYSGEHLDVPGKHSLGRRSVSSKLTTAREMRD